MLKFLKLHPKVAAQVNLFGLAVVGQTILVLQGAEGLKEAAVATGLALALIVRGYLKAA